MTEDIFWTQPDKIPEQFKSWLARFIARNAMVPIDAIQTTAGGGGGSSSTGATSATFPIKVTADDSVLSTGDGQFIFAIPAAYTTWYLTGVVAYVTTVSSSGKPTVQLRNITTGNDMLSTKVSIDANEYTSYTAATPFVVNNSFKQVTKADRIAVDVDISGTGAEGLGLYLTFSKP